MPARTAPPKDPVWIEHDGDRILAERGEPLAVALLAADRVLLARSPKLHRPRGPYCLRGACDGCLARVDGQPNVMTCMREAHGGEQIETQNVIGSRGVDLMEATDYLFPRGIDHHKLFAGVRGVSSLVQSFARRVAGLGKLPDAVVDPQSSSPLRVDVLIVGSGRAGLAVAAGLGSYRVMLVDDWIALGGNLALRDPSALDAALSGIENTQALPATTIVSLSREPGPGIAALCVDASGARLVLPRVVVLATGCHDHIPAFGENDLPGLFSARAALKLQHAGVHLGKRVALVGEGLAADALAQTPDSEFLRFSEAEVVRCSGRGRVRALVHLDGQRERRVSVDCVVSEGPGAPAFELAAQAGAKVRHTSAGFVPVCDASGQVAPGVFAAGSVIQNAVTSAQVATAVRQVLASVLE
ncbi:MAG TPA: 2Fe-2S iron-sulfur cluster-binding protein [Polyangiaceae bacterium]|nr:2Fe-2S iron-sulfur cluster-binding protein [Polyangiaceae bacterium]